MSPGTAGWHAQSARRLLVDRFSRQQRVPSEAGSSVAGAASWPGRIRLMCHAEMTTLGRAKLCPRINIIASMLLVRMWMPTTSAYDSMARRDVPGAVKPGLLNRCGWATTTTQRWPREAVSSGGTEHCCPMGDPTRLTPKYNVRAGVGTPPASAEAPQSVSLFKRGQSVANDLAPRGGKRRGSKEGNIRAVQGAKWIRLAGRRKPLGSPPG